jgi:fatty acid desaturase
VGCLIYYAAIVSTPTQQENVLARPLHKEELKSLSTKSNRIFGRLAVNYSVVIGTVLALSTTQAAPTDPLAFGIYAAAFLSIAWSQLSLLNANHDGLHMNFGKQHNDLLMWILTGYPIGLSLGFRDLHWQHHRHMGDPELDPDFGNYCAFPKSKAALILRVCKNASGIVAVWQFLKGQGGNGKSAWGEQLKMALVQLVILSLFSAVLGPLYYFGFWILPLITLTRAFTFLRTFCEHASPERDFTLRTLRGRWFQTDTLGMYNFNFHSEHHLYPSIPYPNLPGTSALILERLGDPNPVYEVYDGGYLQWLSEQFRALPFLEPKEAHAG